jgi:outer membrane protein insertion porin family
LKAGIVDAYGDSNKVPIFERFFAGGARTIRGYDERGVGPLDPLTGDPIGGESMAIGNIEYTIPLIEFLKLAAFLDAGQVWSKVSDFGQEEFLVGTGIGLRVKTPVGPINLDYGYPLNDEPGKTDKTGKFYFSVSRGF